ncbi:MAG: UDP-N-acetylmuramoyl-L-alanine--D-glutamate ligase [Dehalococcoidia bacterium]|nr:UDP-N-acetylmuramoyl-L-alanine--D-glutamate ligase [Dehalococcoidia bacterium]MCB9485437.1 UDP-N-acetylmuramoyl-L-alanine--D-glutamate ligase [Thermoflexaceae bacterium]
MSAIAGIDNLRGARALVYSLGKEGRDLAGWLLGQGADVTISDTRSDIQLQAAAAVAPAGVGQVVTGQPLLKPDGFDVLAVGQSVLRHDSAVVRAKSLGIPVVSQTQLFLQLCAGRVVGITGSSGKSTTTALVAEMAKDGKVKHVVGGNIGEALLGRLGEIDAETTVVLEISHTQLQYTDRSPGVAAITNVTPNHLDQFDWDAYVELKHHLLEYQEADDARVINVDDPVSRPWASEGSGRVFLASVTGDHGKPGAWLDGPEVMIRSEDGKRHAVANRDALQIRGDHNVANAVMACAVATAAGFPAQAMASACRRFRGVPHRLEMAGTALGATWVNDSIATAPERTMAGLRAFTEPVVLLLGGREKNLPVTELRALVIERCRAVICFGEAGPSFGSAMEGFGGPVTIVDTLEAAVAEASRLVAAGDIVLLSPAGTSFDAFPSFEARGAAFRQLVREMPGYQGPEDAR